MANHNNIGAPLGRRCCAAGSADLQVSPTGSAFVPELMETAIEQVWFLSLILRPHFPGAGMGQLWFGPGRMAKQKNPGGR
jgi:hypothetical protein